MGTNKYGCLMYETNWKNIHGNDCQALWAIDRQYFLVPQLDVKQFCVGDFKLDTTDNLSFICQIIDSYDLVQV